MLIVIMTICNCMGLENVCFVCNDAVDDENRIYGSL